MRGSVKWFNNEKGYGFIECGDLEDIFVHYSAILKDGYKTLNEGDIVDFKLIETAKGLQANEVSTVTLTTTILKFFLFFYAIINIGGWIWNF